MSKAGAGREQGSQNWKPDEVKFLSVRWVIVSEDVLFGKDRKSEKWPRFRIVLGTVQGECSVDWHRKCRSSNLAFKQIQNRKPSGVNNEDIIRMALELTSLRKRNSLSLSMLG